MLRKSTLLITAFLAGSLSTVQAGIYKWTDANGNVHYSQTKPKANKVKRLDVRTRRPATVATPTVNKAGLETEKKPKETKEQKQIKALQSKVKKQNETMKNTYCANLKNSMSTLDIGGRIYETQNGKRKYLSGKEIDAKRVKVRETYNRRCK